MNIFRKITKKLFKTETKEVNEETTLLSVKTDSQPSYSVVNRLPMSDLIPELVTNNKAKSSLYNFWLHIKEHVNSRDESGRTALHWVALTSESDRHRLVAEMLLQSGADANAKDYAGRTPLNCLLKNGRSNPETRKLLSKYMGEPEGKEEKIYVCDDRVRNTVLKRLIRLEKDKEELTVFVLVLIFILCGFAVLIVDLLVVNANLKHNYV